MVLTNFDSEQVEKFTYSIISPNPNSLEKKGLFSFTSLIFQRRNFFLSADMSKV